jgi:hypothetical protein
MVRISFAVAVLALFFIIRYRLYRLIYIPRDPFSPSLEIDMPLMMRSPRWVQDLHNRNITWRRKISKNRDLRRNGQPPMPEYPL